MGADNWDQDMDVDAGDAGDVNDHAEGLGVDAGDVNGDNAGGNMMEFIHAFNNMMLVIQYVLNEDWSIDIATFALHIRMNDAYIDEDEDSDVIAFYHSTILSSYEFDGENAIRAYMPVEEIHEPNSILVPGYPEFRYIYRRATNECDEKHVAEEFFKIVAKEIFAINGVADEIVHLRDAAATEDLRAALTHICSCAMA